MKLCLGIDSSCYTTSLALVNSEGTLFYEVRKILRVPQGSKGLAQNEAVFQHVQNFPELMQSLDLKNLHGKISTVAASSRPRPQEGSYMPVFKVGEGLARSLAVALSVPFVATTHQEGHIAAGLLSIKALDMDEFLALHISGGTTEILRVSRNHAELGQLGFKIELLGGTTDLHAGQFVDRIGVAMGLPFPAGPHLERLAQDSDDKMALPSSVRGLNVSFSGPESAAVRLIEGGHRPEDVARAVEKCIANSLIKLVGSAVSLTGLNKVLVVGGVAANHYIRNALRAKLLNNKNIQMFFAEPNFSSDNATGVAFIGSTL